jgi:hypothetical protein
MRLKLVWSQPVPRANDRARSLLLVSVLCLFLGGVVVGAGGHDLRDTPRPVRAAIASLLTTGGVLFLLGVILLAIRKSRPAGPSRLSIAHPSDASAETDADRHFGQEERR